jgi:hypothetical protein
LEIEEKALGKEHPLVAVRANNIGSALQAQRDYAGALEQYRRALAIKERALGPGHPSTVTTRTNLAVATAESLAVTTAEKSGWSKDGKRGGAVVIRCAEGTCHGLLAGDWIVSYGVTKVRDAKHLRELTKITPETRAVTLSVRRDGKKLELRAQGGRLGIQLL